MKRLSAALPLAYRTPASWTRIPLEDPLALLSDHAYLERKAASNALELLNRWPEPGYPEKWAVTIAAIARDEAAHLAAVARLLKKRGGRLERLHRSAYAADLRALVRRGLGPDEILDRLLISALIEARSCERFELLSQAADAELAAFYKGLCASEAGHFRVFLELAASVRPRAEVARRWREMLKAEGEIIQRQPLGPGLHSGVA